MEYIVTGWTKYANEDNYTDGCKNDTVINCAVHDTFHADTLEVMVKKLMHFVGTDNKEDVLVEAGRIDIKLMENAEGVPASKYEMKDWINGNLKLWLACYSFYVKECTDADLSSLMGKGYSE